MNEFKIDHNFCGITQNPETKNYVMVLNYKCRKCNDICNAIHFQQNFKNWTSGNDDVDKFIQDTQLSAHIDYEVFENALEWIPFDRFNNIEKSRFDEAYKANWIDGHIYKWNDKNQNWERKKQNMIVTLKILNNSKNIVLEFMNEINKSNGITQNPETKNYMMVLNDECKKCKYTCNAIRFQQNFKDWTSDNDDIDKFIQNAQLSAHKNVKEALEWIPYDRFYDIEYIANKKVYKSNWIDGNISVWGGWDYRKQDWERNNNIVIVTLKELNDPKIITLEFMNEIKIDHEFYGITQNPETKCYMMVLNDKCKN
ncbi:hypothetical protein RhiirA5_441204, partial [Rhizophagus irregularis]